jgi:hypothetical protein
VLRSIAPAAPPAEADAAAATAAAAAADKPLWLSESEYSGKVRGLQAVVMDRTVSAHCSTSSYPRTWVLVLADSHLLVPLTTHGCFRPTCTLPDPRVR